MDTNNTKQEKTTSLEKCIIDYIETSVKLWNTKNIIKQEVSKEGCRDSEVLEKDIQELTDLFIEYIDTNSEGVKQKLHTHISNMRLSQDFLDTLLFNEQFNRDLEIIHQWLTQFEEYEHISKEEIPYLAEIDIDEYNLQYIPKEIRCLKNLEKLSLYGGTLESVPQEIEELTNLNSLWLSGKLSIFPTQILKLENLNSLNLSGNNLTTIPKEIEGMNIRTLNLSNNNISVLPKEIAKLSLFFLYLSHNNISVFPQDVSVTFELDLSYNKLTSLPEISVDGSLDLSHNNISILPKISASSLNLSHNNISVFPKDISAGSLDLSYNKLSSLLPKIFTYFSLNLSYNSITVLPKVLEERGFHRLDLSNNRLSSIPVDLLNAIKNRRVSLNLSDNCITSITEEMVEVLKSKFTTIQLSGNKITSIPKGLEFFNGRIVY